MNEIVLLFLEKICEAIYFSLFIIYGKGLKEKRLLFTIIMICEYLLLKSFLHYSIWFQILYIFITYIILKILYKEKTQITDIFLFAIASIILIIFSCICSIPLFYNINLSFFMLTINRIIIFMFLFYFKDKIYILYNKIIKCWNRKETPQKIRSLTLRNISIIIFNLMFYIINLGMIFAIIFIEKR